MEKLNQWLWQDFIEVESTNQTAIDLSADFKGEKFVITAKRQNKGRGRRGRSWISEEGNLFLSMAFPFDIQNSGQLVFIVSLALLQTISRLSPNVSLKLKWPNDVLLNDKKFCGILLEKGSDDYIITGIGINIISSPQKAANFLYETSCLKDAGIEIDRVKLLELFLSVFDNLFSKWQTSGFEPIREEWLQHVKGLNEKIIVNGENFVRQGVFKGVDEKGLLLLEEDGKINKIFAGDVFFPSIKKEK